MSKPHEVRSQKAQAQVAYRRGDQARQDFEHPKSSFPKLLKTLGRQLHDLRKSSFGLTQSQLARAAGFNVNTISHAELGKGPQLTLWTIWRIARAQGYDVQISFVKNRKDEYGQLRSDDVRRALSSRYKGRPDVELEPEREGDDGDVGSGPQD